MVCIYTECCGSREEGDYFHQEASSLKKWYLKLNRVFQTEVKTTRVGGRERKCM